MVATIATPNVHIIYTITHTHIPNGENGCSGSATYIMNILSTPQNCRTFVWIPIEISRIEMNLLVYNVVRAPSSLFWVPWVCYANTMGTFYANAIIYASDWCCCRCRSRCRCCRCHCCSLRVTLISFHPFTHTHTPHTLHTLFTFIAQFNNIK